MYTREDIKVARKNGISRQTFYKRVMDYDWDVERARTEPTQKKFGTKRFTVHSEEHVLKAKEKGISYNAYGLRIKKGYTPEEAVKMPKQQGKVIKSKKATNVC